MTTRVQSSPPVFPVSLPPRPRTAVLDEPPAMRVQTERIADPHRELTMRRQLMPPPAMMMPRRPTPVGREPTRAHAAPMPPPVLALVDELSDLLAPPRGVPSEMALEDNQPDRMRPNEFARPSWCTHAGVTVVRAGRRACLRCGTVLT